MNNWINNARIYGREWIETANEMRGFITAAFFIALVIVFIGWSLNNNSVERSFQRWDESVQQCLASERYSREECIERANGE